jgi:hypothetical protein
VYENLGNIADFEIFVTPSGAFGGISLDGGETVVNRAGRTVPRPPAFRAVPLDSAPPATPEALRAAEALALASERAAAGSRARVETEAAEAEARKAAEAEALRARREAARKYAGSPEGRAAFERELRALRAFSGALDRGDIPAALRAFRKR